MGVARFSQAVIYPFFITENSVLYTELLARLLFFATSYPAMIGQLCQQAQSWFRACPHPMLVPLAGFLQPPGGRFRATLTGCHKGECPQHHKKTHQLTVYPGEQMPDIWGCSLGLHFAKQEAPRYHGGLHLLSRAGLLHPWGLWMTAVNTANEPGARRCF